MTTSETLDTAAQQHSAQQTSTDTASSGQSQSAKTFTQAELDHHAGERAKRAAEAAVKKILGKLGVASEDEIDPLKTTIEDARKRKEADMTEAQKALAERDQLAKQKADLEARVVAIELERRNERIDAALKAEAAKLKSPDVDTVLMFARAEHKATLDTLLSEDGVIDTKALSTLLETIKTQKPHYFAALPLGAGSPSNAGGRTVSADADAMKRASQTNQRIIRGR